MPGPMTIGDTTADVYYGDPRLRGADLADALNREVLDLAEAGCRHIQIDEPLFARKPGDALDFGFEHLERAFHKCPTGVVRTVHMCCGYPDRLDSVDYPKADRQSYIDLASVIEDTSIDAISLEDAHRHNDLKLLEQFEHTTVILGVVAIAKSEVEPVEVIRDRLQTALMHIDEERLLAAPDCGLGLLGQDLARHKLANLCEAAQSFGRLIEQLSASVKSSRVQAPGRPSAFNIIWRSFFASLMLATVFLVTACSEDSSTPVTKSQDAAVSASSDLDSSNDAVSVSFDLILRLDPGSSGLSNQSRGEDTRRTEGVQSDQLLDRVKESFSGDLDRIRERRFLRVLVSYGRTNFFFDAGMPRGFEYDLLMEYEKELNALTSALEDRIKLIFLPVPFDQLLDKLASG